MTLTPEHNITSGHDKAAVLMPEPPQNSRKSLIDKYLYPPRRSQRGNIIEICAENAHLETKFAIFSLPSKILRHHFRNLSSLQENRNQTNTGNRFLPFLHFDEQFHRTVFGKSKTVERFGRILGAFFRTLPEFPFIRSGEWHYVFL